MWPGIHLAHNSAKLKIINLPKHYPVVKVRPCGLGRMDPANPAVRWSVGVPTDQRNDENKNDGLRARASYVVVFETTRKSARSGA